MNEKWKPLLKKGGNNNAHFPAKFWLDRGSAISDEWLWTGLIVDDVLLSIEGKGHTDFIWESSEFGDMYMWWKKS